MTTSQIILASASPRRQELLAQVVREFKVVASGIDETAFSTTNISPIDYSKKLALAKADDVAARFPGHLVIGADTVVDFDGRIIGKPRDSKDAEAITKMLFSKPHRVITTLALVRKTNPIRIVETETTAVYPKKLTDSQIAAHVASGVWRDKAGAYAIADKDDPFIDHIDGSLTNVMGLPLELLNRLLQQII